jgi:hypothetical protein
MHQPKVDISSLQINDSEEGRGLLRIKILYKENSMKTKEAG